MFVIPFITLNGFWGEPTLLSSAIKNLSALTANVNVEPPTSLADELRPKPPIWPLLLIFIPYFPFNPLTASVVSVIVNELAPKVVFKVDTWAAAVAALLSAVAAAVDTRFNSDILAKILVPVPPVTIASKFESCVACDVALPSRVLTVAFNELCWFSVANLGVVPSASNACDSRLVILLRSNVILPVPVTCNISKAETLEANDVDAEPLTVVSKPDVNVSNAVIFVPWSVTTLTPLCVIIFSSTNVLPSTVDIFAIWFCKEVDSCDVSILPVAAARSTISLSISILACVTSDPVATLIIVPLPEETVELKSLISTEDPTGGAVENVITLSFNV